MTKMSAYQTEEEFRDLVMRAARDPDFPQYGYGIVLAFSQALALAESGLSLLELGVAGGNGLVAMERLAATYNPERALEVAISGFDLGSGMPAPLDYRDVPHIWKEGFYKMDLDRLMEKLSAARVILGDIRETGKTFIAEVERPIGFISFDLDFYSSTTAAFSTLLYASPDKFLPRVVCYFDDTVGPHSEMHSEYTGELLAIREFNAANTQRKIAKLNGLQQKLAPITGNWIEGIFILHLFDHPRYNDYVYQIQDRQLPLTV
ncbi:hypothetical protein [Mesorhizobium sp. M1403]|uniref:hypothetical protein n=1 Tax=Mesorhizobium sp. M1403 TaxID=2957097 RepID=UPI003337302E